MSTRKTRKTTTRKTTRPTRVDWSLVPRGPVSGAAVGAAALAATGAVGGVADVSPLIAAAGAGVGALGSVLEAAHRQGGPGALLYRLGAWVGAGGWLTWAWSSDAALSANGLAALGAGAVGAATLAPLGRIRPAERRAAQAGELVPVAGDVADPIAADWEARFKRVCRIAVKVVDVEHWDNGAGYTITGQLPPGPATVSQILASCDALATDARLPDGCGVEPPEPGRHRGEFKLRVSTRNLLGVRGDEHPPKVPYPPDYGPRSLLDPIALGVRRDGSVAEVRLREDSMLAIGPKGSGKTNLLDVATCGLGRCIDTLVWHIDLNGGGMSQFWLHPWLEGKCARPPIDWAASNPEEALLMVTVALAIAKDRKSSYRTYKAQRNVKLLPISPDLPAIAIMVDESAEVMSPNNRDPIITQIRDGLEELLRIGRNEAVFPHFSALRPVQTTIPPDVLAGCAWRLAMFGTSAADLGHLYEWPKGLNMADLPVKGTAFLAHKPDAPAPMKAYFLKPEQIQDAAIAIAKQRPELDETSTEVANAEHEIRFGPKGTKPTVMSDIYATRYERMRKAFLGEPLQLTTGTGAQAAPRPAPAPAAVPGTPVAAPSPLPKLRVLRGGAADWPDPLQVAAPAAPTVGASAADWPDLFPTATSNRQAQAGGATVAELDPAPPAPVPDILARALQAFDAAQDDRMHSEVLAEALGLESVTALAEALRPYGVSSRPKFVRNGQNRRGYWRDDIEAAARAAQTAPADAAAH